MDMEIMKSDPGLYLHPLLNRRYLLASICALSIPAAAQGASLLPQEEGAGIDGVVAGLLSAFDHVDIIGLGEAHQRKMDSDIRIALIRHPDFAKKVGSVVIEFGSTTEQATLDRYIRGENVSDAELQKVWKSTTQAPNGVWDSPVYPAFFAAVREVNAKLPATAQIRVFGGDPGPGDNRGREGSAVSVVKSLAMPKHGKVLIIYGAAHFYRTAPAAYLASLGGGVGIGNLLEKAYPGRTLRVIVVGDLPRPPAQAATDMPPNYRKFDSALKSPARPILVSLQRSPFRDFTAQEFLSRTLTTCLPPGGCRSVFKGSDLTLGQMADACIYFGPGASG
jgi:hypothetical protein